MVRLIFGLLSTFAVSAVCAFPLRVRISETEEDSTKAWQAACMKAGGGQKCNDLAVAAFSVISSFTGICDQQDAADNMVDLAKQLNDSDTLMLAQIYVQQPHSSPDKSQFPYCQKAPRNLELNGLFHCQFSGSDFSKFSGDQTGNTPLGLNAPVSPPGACPASPDGPIPDGEQLQNLVSSPGAPFNPDGTSQNQNSNGTTPTATQELASTIVFGEDELPSSLGTILPFPVLVDEDPSIEADGPEARIT